MWKEFSEKRIGGVEARVMPRLACLWGKAEQRDIQIERGIKSGL